MKHILPLVALLLTQTAFAGDPVRQALYSMCVNAVAEKDPSPIARQKSRSNQYLSGNTRIEWAFLLRNGDKCNCEGFHSLMGRHGLADQGNGPNLWVSASCGGIDFELSPNENGDQGGSLLPIGGPPPLCTGYRHELGLCP